MKPYLVVLGTWSVDAVIALSRFNAVQVTTTCWVVVAAGSAKLVGEALVSQTSRLIDVACVFELSHDAGDFALSADQSL